MSLSFDPARTEAEIAVIAGLAREIWYEYYVPLIGRAQVDYMVGKFQSPAAMLEQVQAGYRYFLVRSDACRSATRRSARSRRASFSSASFIC